MKETPDVVIAELDRSDVLRSPEPKSDHSADMVELPPALSSMDVLERLWIERDIVLRAAIAGLLVFTILAFLLPKRYTATTQLMPPDYGGNSAMALALPGMSDEAGSGAGLMGMANRLLGMNTSGDLFLGVIRSQTVEDRVITKLSLMDAYSCSYLQDARKELETRTTIETDAKTGIVSISVEDKIPARAAEIAKSYVAELNQVLAEVNTSSAHRERIFLEERLDQIKQQSDADAKDFALFASQNAAVDIPDQAKSMVTAGAQLQSQLIVAESELKGLQEIYADGNPRVRAAKARVEELQRQANKFGGKDVDLVNGAALDPKELYPSVRQLPLLGVKYLDLYRRSKVDDAVFELLTKEYEIAKIQESREVASAQVLDVALIPEKKSSPHRLRIALVGMLLGLMLSSAYLVSQMIWDRTDDGDRRKMLVRDVAGTIGRLIEQIPFLKKFASGHFGISAQYRGDSSLRFLWAKSSRPQAPEIISHSVGSSKSTAVESSD